MAPAGRKRAFDKEQALEKAMQLFWANGYSGTSLADLTAALGINKPSLYAAFGNKEQLFKAAVAHYVEQYGKPSMGKLTRPATAPLSKRLKAFMYASIDLIAADDNPTGCLLVLGSCESGSHAVPAEIADSLKSQAAEQQTTLRHFFHAEKLAGNLAPTARPDDIARYLLSVTYGMTVLAKNGSSRSQLRAVADRAIASICSD